jgi:hypothetical protein
MLVNIQQRNVVVVGRLEQISRDTQNVHTREVVDHIKTIIEKLQKIPVPKGYGWKKITCSKTPGEIIVECKLSNKAALQMMTQYSQDTSIYNMGEGIYGKTLDHVWQFVKTHAEKESLINIIRQELQDNVGMCAQGNLTRICNVLAGYVEGIGVQESVSEKLGRLLPPLREIEDETERRTRMENIFSENNISEDQRAPWIEAVMG